jgi:hypothetical protein
VIGSLDANPHLRVPVGQCSIDVTVLVVAEAEKHLCARRSAQFILVEKHSAVDNVTLHNVLE